MRGLERIAADRRHLVARQVRCSTGFTWGRAGEAGLGAVVARPVPEVAQTIVRQADARAEASARAGALLLFLRSLPEGSFLPSATEIARVLKFTDRKHGNEGTTRVAGAFLALESKKLLVSAAGGRERFRGERMVLLREPARLLRTEGAPAFWESLLKGAV